MGEKSGHAHVRLDLEQVESALPKDVDVIPYEEEPTTAYTVGVKTWLAVLALALTTASAVVSTTVSNRELR